MQVHVVQQLQDSSIRETVVDEAAAVEIYSRAVNDPTVYICNAFVKTLGEDEGPGYWMYHHQVEPAVMTLDQNGYELPEAVEPETPLVTATTGDGLEVSGFILASLDIPGDRALWFQTVEGDLITIVQSQVLAEPIAELDVRQPVYSHPIGPKQVRNAVRGDEVTAYLEAGDITGPQVTILHDYPEPYVQILEGETVWVVMPEALTPPEAQTPATAAESEKSLGVPLGGATEFMAFGSPSSEEHDRRAAVMEATETLRALPHDAGKEALTAAVDGLKTALDALTEPWSVADDLRGYLASFDRKPLEGTTDGQNAPPPPPPHQKARQGRSAGRNSGKSTK